MFVLKEKGEGEIRSRNIQNESSSMDPEKVKMTRAEKT